MSKPFALSFPTAADVDEAIGLNLTGVPSGETPRELFELFLASFSGCLCTLETTSVDRTFNDTVLKLKCALPDVVENRKP